MTKLKLWPIALLLFTVALLSSCEKENLNENAPNQNEISNVTTQAIAAAASSKNASDEEDCGCYSVFENIDFEASDEDIEAAIDAVLASMTEEEVEALFTPVCVDGEIYESACIADCEGVTGYAICTEEELGDDYFWDELGCEEDIEFPFEVELPNGSSVTVNSYDELFDLLDEWYGGDWDEENWDEEDCYELVYPVTIINTDGTETTVNSEEELEQLYDEYFETEGEEEEDFPYIAYPFDVIDEEGNTITVNSEEEEYDLYDNCEEWDEEWEEEICFDLVYPIQLTNPSGEVITVNSEEELEALFDNIENEEDCPEIVYPYDIVFDDGMTITITNEAEEEEAFDVCFDDISVDEGSNNTVNTSLSQRLQNQPDLRSKVNRFRASH